MTQPQPLPPKPRGRQFFANPGPTNIPDSILRAINTPSIDFNDPDFMAVHQYAYEGLKRVLRTNQHLFMYASSGHGAWEATLCNVLSPGDEILIVESGYFSEEWGVMAAKLGLKPRTVHADWRRGVDIAEIGAVLRQDTGHAIKAVCVVHNETATGVALPLPAIRDVIDAAGHPALYLADTISSLGSLEFRMDDWRLDGVVGGSQKGLMLPTGMSFSGVRDTALAAHATAKLPRHYFDWSVMKNRRHTSFVGTVPVSFFYGLKEAIRLIEEEGLDNLVARHHRLAEATRRAVRAWSGNAGPQLFCLDPSRYSDSVTAILMPEGYSGDALRATARQRFNVSLGGGLGPLSGKVFRIGHLGDLNEPMLLGALGAVEMSLRLNGVPHGTGGVAAALDYLTEAAAAA
jgi:alanine-glyoxylate transaminase/serine-glyoxylate transaminase/serine-pyruvate transaminase